jgi:MFS family permease
MAYSYDAPVSSSIPRQVSFSRSILIVSLCAAFLFYKYIIQNFPSVMAPELMDAFHLQGLGLGVLSGVYFWTYLIMPLFVGILLDAYGARWLTAAAIFSCVAGLFLFAQAEHLNTAILGRALTGLGVSFAAIAYFKLASVWFAKKHYALLTSLLVSSGMMGAVFGQAPLAYLVEHVGWRDSLSYLAWLGIALALFFILYVKDEQNSSAKPIQTGTQSALWHDVLQIIKNKNNWLLAAYNGLAFAPLVVFCGLWGNPFLQKAYGLDKVASPSLISLVFIGLAVSSLLFGMVAHYVRKRRAVMFYSTVCSAVCLSLVIYAHPMPLWLLGSLLFFFGFCLGPFSLVFVIGKELNPLHLAGTTISLINASDAFLDAVTEPAIGKVLDWVGSTGSYGDGFSLLGYHIALAILPLYQVIGAVLLKWVKDES